MLKSKTFTLGGLCNRALGDPHSP